MNFDTRLTSRRVGNDEGSVSARAIVPKNGDDVIHSGLNPEEYWKGRGFMYFLIQALNNYTIVLLFISAGLLFAIEIVQQGPEEGWHDGVTVLFAIFLLVSFSSVGRFYRERKEAKKLLLKEKCTKVNVERNGKVLPVSACQVRVWDTVHFEEGDQIQGDGLLTSLERLRLDEVHNSVIDRVKNPFLVSGSKVKEGRGSMIVTSLASSCEDSGAGSRYDPNEDGVFQASMQRPYVIIDKLVLMTSLLIALTSLIRLLLAHKKHVGHYNGVPEMKGHLTMKMVIDLFEKLVLKPQGRVSKYLSALVVLAVSFQHGMPFIVSVCLSYWNTKLSINGQLGIQSLSACCTMGLVNVAVVDVTHIGLGGSASTKTEVKDNFKALIDALRELGLKNIKLVSEDDLSVVKSIAMEIGLPRSSIEVEADTIRSLDPSKIDDITIIGNCRPEDKFHLVEMLQKHDQVVAYVGGLSARDIPTLKKADLVIVQETRCIEMTKILSDILLKGRYSLADLVTLRHYGRCAYSNIQRFFQLQLTFWISGLFISLVWTMLSGESPLSSVHIIWVNFLLLIMSGLMDNGITKRPQTTMETKPIT